MDTFAQLCGWLTEVGIKGKDAQKYAGALCEEQLDTVEKIARASADTLKGVGIKKVRHCAVSTLLPIAATMFLCRRRMSARSWRLHRTLQETWVRRRPRQR